MKKIKILVIDDKQENLDKAKEQFKNKNVELTCCSFFSAAKSLLGLFNYDIVLTDLMMPAEKYGCSLEYYKTEDAPYGLVIAIIAKNKGVKNVKILTDLDHHHGPIAYAMDAITKEDIFISREYDKDWLSAANYFVKITDNKSAILKNIPRVSPKSTLMVTVQNMDFSDNPLFMEDIEYPGISINNLGLEVIGIFNYNYKYPDDDECIRIMNAFWTLKPDYVLLYGANIQMNQELIKLLLGTKSPKQKIVITNYGENNFFYEHLPIGNLPKYKKTDFNHEKKFKELKKLF